MRKLHRNLILEIVKPLCEAPVKIQKVFFDKDSNKFNSLISEWYIVANEVSAFVVQFSDKDSPFSLLLIEFKDIILKIQNDPDNAYDLIKQLKKQATKIENSVKTDLKIDKFEIVFLPYNASMWDSMESLWLAAKDDPSCESYVVPIPYYVRNTANTLGEFHYEGNQFPTYVPITSWQKYDIKTRCPDVIVFHNPYDEFNIVTSVHPDFYAKKLKDYTNLLVYIPYFTISSNIVPESFTNMPGIIYADKVFLESEKICECYISNIKHSEKKLRQNFKDGKFDNLESKFMAFGSPKFDVALNKQLDDFTLPKEWERLIVNPDGSRKKVILYNTTIAAMLRGTSIVNENGKTVIIDTYLKKIKSVIEAFKNRSDVVLWWRPHPLMISTFETMRPYLLEEYIQIVDEFKSESFGVYDESSEIIESS